ncbi:MAG: bifunctional methylenetetrahydrofolate dehydrogenase/methenyltetrahydrofolate cyclohydrolase FolD [Bdellovibrionales bacterium]|nr:bifunctional methylenetetrahydrofolate dehydrogenase/methenyltetrahydrofolate cyclohydrolase FolD [Bdellovibrionales bacterium]
MQLLDGKKVAEKILQEVQNDIATMEVKPGLAVILIGDDPASQVYVNRKHKTCQKVGMYSEVIRKNANVTQEEVLVLIEDLNQRKDIHGILVQLPLPKHLDEEVILRAVDENKDVDGFHLINTGKLFRGQDALTPCTPTGVIRLLKEYDINMQGANAVVIGRSNIVGKPMAHLLLGQNATVTICHSKTKDIEKFCQKADIVVAAVGIAQLVKASWIKPGACIVDVGINRLNDGKLVGDVDFEDCKTKAGYLTPVPGGVGPLTIAVLLQNTVKACKKIT